MRFFKNHNSNITNIKDIQNIKKQKDINKINHKNLYKHTNTINTIKTKNLSSTQKTYIGLGFWMFFLCVLMTLRPLALPDEGRYAEVGRWMWQSGDALVPRINGLPFFHKPPLLYWLEALFIGIFGAQIAAVRLVVVLHTCLWLVGLYWLVKSHTPTDVKSVIARRTSWIFASSLTFLGGGQYINHDTMVATWIGIAIGSFALFFREKTPHHRWACLGFAACGLGFLSKGLIGLVLPGAVVFLWLMWLGQIKRLLMLPWLRGISVLLLLILPWLFLVNRVQPDMFFYLFGVQQVARYLGGSVYTSAAPILFNNVHPWWFYEVAMLLLLFPWLGFAVYAMCNFFCSMWRVKKKKPTRHAVHVIEAIELKSESNSNFGEESGKLCMVWIAVILLFFSIPASKLVGYILPAMPPLAWLSAHGFGMLSVRWQKMFVPLCVLGALLGLGVTLSAKHYTENTTSAADVALFLRENIKPSDTVLSWGRYPYDVPFLAQLKNPILVVNDWERAKLNQADDWQHELLEAARFAPNLAKETLQPISFLEQPNALASHQWLLAAKIKRDTVTVDTKQGWVRMKEGHNWDLWRR